MTSGYGNAIDLAAGTVLLAALLIAWRHEVSAMVRLLALQGAALAAIPLVEGVHERDGLLFAVGLVVLGLRTTLLPMLLRRAARAEGSGIRESEPLVNTPATLLICAVLSLVSFAAAQPVVRLDPASATQAMPAALAASLIAILVMVTRRRALSQAIGFLMLDNGIAATAFLLTSGVPLVVELGASLDVLFAVLILGVLTGRLRAVFGNTDLDQLTELRDR
jgi:hydrogenase-4 component E